MTRQEAIRRIKAWNLDSDDMEVLTVVIPELAESEDDRMIREIKRYIKEQGDKPNGLPNGTVSVSDMIAWLEKRGGRDIDCPQKHQDNSQPNGCIVLEDFNGGEGFYKLNLDYLNKKQVEEVEEMVRTWNKESKASNENIKACIGMCLTDANEQRFKDYNTSLKDCLDWLEKQKEQKPLHWRRIEDATTQRTDDGCCVTSEKMLVKGWINDGDYRIVDEGTMVNRDILCIPVRELNAEQKEQKPELPRPHKGDDTNPYDMSVSEAQEYAIKRGFGVPFNDGEVYVDERHITQTIGNILRWADEHPKEQKPAEWSEEDKEMLEYVIGDVNDAKQLFATKEAIDLCDKEITWLKSLSPSWKPSEEQIKAVAHAYNSFPNDCPTKSNLRLLYHDLEKLM